MQDLDDLASAFSTHELRDGRRSANMASWLLGKGLDALSSLRSSFTPQLLPFSDELQVMTTALLAEGGYSYVYSAKEYGALKPRQFAAKKVLAQDEETRAIAETEGRLLRLLDGKPGFVRCYGTMMRPAPTGPGTEYWFLLEYCPNGSLIDLIYEKTGTDAAGAPTYERRPPLPQERVLEVFESVASAVAHMHAMKKPMQHRDLKLENVLGQEDGVSFVLCDFGSATSEVLPAERTRKQALAEEEKIAKYSTQMYRAPEMIDLYRNQEVGLKVDVWALGCLLYSLCFREHPFDAEASLQILNAGYTIPSVSATWHCHGIPTRASCCSYPRAALQPGEG